jgi:hypothetical protein
LSFNRWTILADFRILQPENLLREKRDHWRERMTDEEFLTAQRKLTIDAGNEVLRLLKADVDVMEIARDVLGTARDEIKNHPSLFFQALGGGSPADTLSSDLGVHDEQISGGQTQGGGGGKGGNPPPPPPQDHPWIDLIKKQKELLIPLLPKLLQMI